jgi:hypothetical protein
VAGAQQVRRSPLRWAGILLLREPRRPNAPVWSRGRGLLCARPLTTSRPAAVEGLRGNRRRAVRLVRHAWCRQGNGWGCGGHNREVRLMPAGQIEDPAD